MYGVVERLQNFGVPRRGEGRRSMNQGMMPENGEDEVPFQRCIILYCNDISNYAAAVKIVLNYKHVDYKMVLPPDGYGSSAYKAIVPSGKIPAIVDSFSLTESPFVLSESAVILEYLEETFPCPSLLFKSPQRNANSRYAVRVHDLYMEPALRSLFSHMRPSVRELDFC